MVKFILVQTSGVHLSDILCFSSFRDSVTVSNICIQNCGVSSQQRNAWLNYLFSFTASRGRARAHRGWSSGHGWNQTVWQTHPDPFLKPRALFWLPASLHIWTIRRAVWTRRLFPVALLQLLPIMQHNTDVSLHLCFRVPLKYTPFQGRVSFLLLGLNTTLGQGSRSNLDSLEDVISANHLGLGTVLKRHILPRTQLCTVTQSLSGANWG